ncbi:DUF6462 family protein [Butyrivibrio sp. JL13D10]|uniref:DUF6462 family protein n=1 Tax=Butyrivibrio sp. JL13D10 TaxID=3236815 RepID=UPI0038B53054
MSYQSERIERTRTMVKKLFTYKECMEYFGIKSKTTIRKYAEECGAYCQKNANTVRIDAQVLENYLLSFRTGRVR